MKSSTLKAEGLAWLRYVKRADSIATEIGPYSADILGVNSSYSIEVEVKCTLADLKNDFKKTKHILYQGNVPGTFVPNFFYVMVPVDLEEKALVVLDEKGPKYGLLVFEENKQVLAGRQCRVARRPQRLHDGKPRDKLLQVLTARMSSELIGLHLLVDKWSLQLSDLLSEGHRGILASIDRVLVAPMEPDPEES